MVKLLFYILFLGLWERNPDPTASPCSRKSTTIPGKSDVTKSTRFHRFSFTSVPGTYYVQASHHIVLFGDRNRFGDDCAAAGKCAHTRPWGRRPPRRTFFFKFTITRWKREWSPFWRAARARTRLTTRQRRRFTGRRVNNNQLYSKLSIVEFRVKRKEVGDIKRNRGIEFFFFYRKKIK